MSCEVEGPVTGVGLDPQLLGGIVVPIHHAKGVKESRENGFHRWSVQENGRPLGAVNACSPHNDSPIVEFEESDVIEALCSSHPTSSACFGAAHEAPVVEIRPDEVDNVWEVQVVDCGFGGRRWCGVVQRLRGRGLWRTR